MDDSELERLQKQLDDFLKMQAEQNKINCIQSIRKAVGNRPPCAIENNNDDDDDEDDEDLTPALRLLNREACKSKTKTEPVLLNDYGDPIMSLSIYNLPLWVTEEIMNNLFSHHKISVTQYDWDRCDQNKDKNEQTTTCIIDCYTLQDSLNLQILAAQYKLKIFNEKNKEYIIKVRPADKKCSRRRPMKRPAPQSELQNKSGCDNNKKSNTSPSPPETNIPSKNKDLDFLYGSYDYYVDTKIIERKMNIYICPEQGCSMTFKSIADKGTHLKVVHKIKHPFSCSRCEKSWSSYSGQSAHNCINEVKKVFCDVCERYVSRMKDHEGTIIHRDNLKDLALKKLEGTVYSNQSDNSTGVSDTQVKGTIMISDKICPKCQKKKISVEKMEIHMKKCRGRKCTFCDKLFSTKSALNSHVKTKHKE